MLLIGLASAPLTGGMDLAFGARTPVADGWTEVRDEPWARAMVLDDTFRQIALVGVDLFTIDSDLVEAAAQRVWETVRIPPSRVYVVPTGTLTAPLAATLPGLAQRPALYCAHVVEQIASAVIYAARGRIPATLGWCRGSISLGETATGPLVLRADTSEGEPLGLLLELPHLPAVGGRVLSADYPGEVARALARAAPQLDYVGLLGAAAGSGSPEPEIRTVGERLAALAWATWHDAEPVPEAQFRSRTERVSLPLELPDPGIAAERLEAAEAIASVAAEPAAMRRAESAVARARAAFIAAQTDEPIERDVRLDAVSLGNGILLGSPLLTTPEIQRRVYAVSAVGARTLLASGVNGLLGVLTTPERRLLELEAWPAALPFAPAAAERFVAAAGRLTERLTDGR